MSIKRFVILCYCCHKKWLRKRRSGFTFLCIHLPYLCKFLFWLLYNLFDELFSLYPASSFRRVHVNINVTFVQSNLDSCSNFFQAKRKMIRPDGWYYFALCTSDNSAWHWINNSFCTSTAWNIRLRPLETKQSKIISSILRLNKVHLVQIGYCMFEIIHKFKFFSGNSQYFLHEVSLISLHNMVL